MARVQQRLLKHYEVLTLRFSGLSSTQSTVLCSSRLGFSPNACEISFTNALTDGVCDSLFELTTEFKSRADPGDRVRDLSFTSDPTDDLGLYNLAWSRQ